ncbi:hypothetical protein BDP27DRAFT_1547755 [Rhodocollybia butyracea]|uniref:Uncharacterized protein n=1 Tax=Rhodocollybia butyracea TaxID=206335 RepID=A0A9P5PHZ3_9AGAR|nr:hypothetical protein BDP27DRAFT_1547755 [Rhodocollybia butyracea]
MSLSQLRLAPRRSEATLTEVTLTFLNVQTGEIKDGSPSIKYEKKIRIAIKNALGIKNIKIDPHGSDDTDGQEDTLFFNLVGGKDCKPGLDQFKAADDCVGVSPVTARVKGPAQKEWNTSRDKARLVFERLLRQPAVSPTGRLPVGRSAVIFIDGQTGQPKYTTTTTATTTTKSLDQTTFDTTQAQSAFTRTISAALGVDQEEVRYLGVRQFRHTYLGFSKGEPGPDKFSAVEAYPLFSGGKVGVAMHSTHTEWTLIAQEFNDHFMKGIAPDSVILSHTVDLILPE